MFSDLKKDLEARLFVFNVIVQSTLHPGRKLRHNDPKLGGLSGALTAGLVFLFVGIFAIVVLAVFGQFAAISAIWPSANVTKITTNIANSVVTGAAFLSIIVILIMVGFLFVVIGALQEIVT